MMYKKAVVFGVFDGLHPGHQYFLVEAKKLCQQLVVSLSAPEMVKNLKGSIPDHSYDERLGAIKEFNQELIVFPGDAIIGRWTVLAEHEPDVVILGYDQQAIARELEKMTVPFIFLDSHFPQKYKSSLLRK